MFGTQVKQKFNTLIDEIYSGYWSDSELNRFFESAANHVTDDLIKDFESNNLDFTRLRPLIVDISVTPTQNSVDISATSTEVPNCRQVIHIEPTFSSSQKTLITQPLKYSEMGGTFAKGSVRYPRYFQNASELVVFPDNIPCTNVVVYYIRNPFYIDVTDNTTVIPYTDAMIELLIKAAIAEATRSAREYSASNVQQQITNMETK